MSRTLGKTLRYARQCSRALQKTASAYLSLVLALFLYCRQFIYYKQIIMVKGTLLIGKQYRPTSKWIYYQTDVSVVIATFYTTATALQQWDFNLNSRTPDALMTPPIWLPMPLCGTYKRTPMLPQTNSLQPQQHMPQEHCLNLNQSIHAIIFNQKLVDLVHTLTPTYNGQTLAKWSQPHNGKYSKSHGSVTPFDSWNRALNAIKRRGVLAIVHIMYAFHGHAEECQLVGAHVRPVSDTS